MISLSIVYASNIFYDIIIISIYSTCVLVLAGVRLCWLVFVRLCVDGCGGQDWADARARERRVSFIHIRF